MSQCRVCVCWCGRKQKGLPSVLAKPMTLLKHGLFTRDLPIYMMNLGVWLFANLAHRAPYVCVHIPWLL